MDSHNALEALVQRGRSPLFLALISVYQEAFDALRDAPSASHDTIVKTLRCECKFPEKLKQAISRHMALAVRHVAFFDELFPNMAAATTTALQPPVRKRPTWTLNMAATAVAAFYDDRQGRFVGDPKGLQDQTTELALTTGWWRLRDTANAYLFTAEEAAAITLHELGHFDYRIRTFSRIEKTMADGSDVVRYTQTSPDLAVIELLLKRLSASPYLDDTWRKLLQTTKTYFATKPNTIDPVYIEALNTLTVLVEAELAGMLIPTYTQLVYDSGFRSAEIRTIRHETDEERSADEFAARHGASSEVAAFLHKSIKLMTTETKPWLSLMVPDVLANIVGSLIHFHQYFDVSAEDVGYGYDAMLRRMELLAETTKHAFSDAGLPVEVKTELKEKIVLCEQYIREYNDASHRRFRLVLKAWRDRVAVIGRIIATPFDERLRRDYGHLQEATRTLSRNPLYYLADK